MSHDTDKTPEEQHASEVEKMYTELEAITGMQNDVRHLQAQLAGRRRQMVIRLRDPNGGGQTYRQIADRLGVTRSAIQQIIA